MCGCTQTPCCCEPVVVTQNCDPCSTAAGCPINLDTSCVFYNLTSDAASALTCLNLSNGTTLKAILEAIDTKLCTIAPYNMLSYDLPCLRGSYVVNDFEDFVEAVDTKLCVLHNYTNTVNTTLIDRIASLETTVLSIYTPNISDCGTIGLLPTDTIFDVLQKYANIICTILSTCCGLTSPDIVTVDSSTVSFVTTGVQNHTITATVNVSSVLGNLITILPDGLYCTVTVPDYTQVLSFNSGTNTITLSNGGGSIILNPDLDEQTLSFDCVSKLLTISNGNSVDLSCIAGSAFAETPLIAVDTATIDFTTSGTSGHILTGSVLIPALISGTAGNAISISAGGLYASTADDKYVKLNALDPTAGYLEDKVAGKINSLITTTTTSNNGTHKTEIEAVLDVAALLTTIAANSTFLTAFCNIVAGCMCFTFRISNSGAGANNYSYVDCSGNPVAGSLPAGSSIDVCGESADTTAPTEVIIQNLGLC